MIHRVLNWDVHLVTWANMALYNKFEYGMYDCGVLVRSAYHHMYGQELWPEIPYWDSALGAMRVIVEYGTVGSLLKYRGATEWPTPYFAQSGDTLLLAGDHHPFDESVMVVVGQIAISAHPERGVEQLSLQAILDGPEPVVALHMPFELEE